MCLRIQSRPFGEGAYEQGVIFLWRKSRDAYEEDIFLRKPLFGAPYFTRDLRRCVEIDRNTVPNHGGIADSIHTLEAGRDFSGYRYGNNSPPVSKALQPAGPRFDLTLCNVVYRMYHQARLEIHQRRESVSHYVNVSMHDVRPEFLEDAVQTIVGTAIKSRSFAVKPGLQASLIELLFQI